MSDEDLEPCNFGDEAEFENGEVMVAIEPEGVLIEGSTAAVDEYVRRLREVSGYDADVSEVDVNRGLIGSAIGLAAGARSVASQSAKFVQLSPGSVKALKAGKSIPGDPGYWRMMTRNADGKFLKQLQWKSSSMGPQRLMSIQMIAVQIALSSAIAQVDESVRRVEGKVDAVLQLAEATRVGDIIGNNATIDRMVDYVDKHGSLPDALWDSVASLGPALSVTVEQLRNHIARVLGTLESSEESVGKRGEALRRAVKDSKLAETLDLLIVAEESLYKWQRLLVNRVAATQRNHLHQVIASSRELMATELEQDTKVYRRAVVAVDAAARRDDIDGFQFWILQRLNKDRDTLRKALNDFAAARRHQAESWDDLAIPKLTQAASAAVDRALNSTGQTLAIGGHKIVQMGEYLVARELRRKSPEESKDDTQAEE
ncbi:MAG: hypothetical protein JWR32_5244 [Mycobacterium sp.]|jgi:hypothetical protein|nr:hypothetical protein [Mycobacterium sp.]